MENNTSYNLVNQLTQESKSLWRIKNVYLAEAVHAEEKLFWSTLAQQKEQTVIELTSLIKNSL